MTLVIGLALAIGLLLGLLGGGGSVLTVPVLVYLVGMDPKTAIATSLTVVGVTSFTAMINHARSGRVCWKTGITFGIAGMLGAYVGGRLAAFVPGGILLLLFAAIMFGTAVAMLRARRTDTERSGNAPICPANLPVMAILFDGLVVGAATGLVGAGGGFLVVPALNLLGGLPMHAAIGTSLLVITLKSFAALAGYVSHVTIDLQLVTIISAVAVVGSLLGGLLSHRISARGLRRAFAAFVVAVACYLLYKELSFELLDEARDMVMEHPDFFWGMLTLGAFILLYRLRAWIHNQGLLRRVPH